VLEIGAPAALLAVPLIGLIWWLHRHSAPTKRVAVAAVFLWHGATPHTAAVARRARRADPVWLLRAAIALLLIAALADLAWRRPAVEVVVWFDDSLSMRAVEAQGTRVKLARDALLAALADTSAATVTLRSLADPKSALALRAPFAAAAIDEWLTTRAPAEPAWPGANELDAAAEHWLVTDGADAAVAGWLAGARVSRVIEVGQRTDNVAVTRLAARPSLTASQRWTALAELQNSSAAAATRGVELRVGEQVARRWQLALAPGATTALDFDLPATTEPIAVVLASGADALADDDALSLVLPPPAVPIDVAATCAPSLAAAVAAHPRLQRAGVAAARLRVACGDGAPAGGTPTLWVHDVATDGTSVAADALPAWSRAAPAALAALILEPEWLALAADRPEGETWLAVGDRPALVFAAQPTPTLHVLFDLGRETLIHRPEYPALVAALLEVLEPAAALDPLVTTARDPAASFVAPHRLSPPSAAPVVAAPRALALQPWLLGAAALLLLADAALLARRRPTHAALEIGARVGLAAWLLATPLLPAPFERAPPHDLIVLWDDSASMQAADLVPSWDALTHVARTLPRGSRLGLVRFGADADAAPLDEGALAALAAGAPPARAAPLARSATNFDAAVRSALRLADPARPTALAVISDGRFTTPRPSGDLGVPVYVLQPRSARAAPTLTLRAPERAAAGEVVPIDITLETEAAVDGRLALDVDGAERASTAVELAGPGLARVRFELAVTTGVESLRASWRGNAPRVERELALAVDGNAPWLVVTREPAGAAVAALRAAGWPLVAATPADFVGYTTRLDEPAGIVLDDLAIGDLAPSSWQALEDAVASSGATLLVLGGQRSFGAGGYRHSTLEALLPVTAEAADPRNVSAVLFVVDASGSMGRSSTHVNPMSYAQRAVLETASTLTAGDEVGLMAFDIDARTLLPLKRYADPVTALDGAFGALGAAGGTRLRPALQDAFATLETTRLERRLLVLVSDGFVASEELEAPLAALAAQGTELVVLAVGRDADTVALRRLVGATNLFRVEQVSELPTLMRSAVEQRRRPSHEGPTPVRVVTAVPGIRNAESWPPLAGLARTRPKPAATVYLESIAGEPLLAVQRAGAGRVVAMPAGLGRWAEPWTRGAAWPELGRALDAWLADRDASASLHTSVSDDENGWRVAVDALDSTGDWSTVVALDATLTDPVGATTAFTLPRVAPGRYAAALPDAGPGRYTLTVAHGERRVTRVLYRESAAPRELAAPNALPAWFASSGAAPAPDRAADWVFSTVTTPARAAAWWLAALLAAFIALLARPHLAALRERETA